MFEYNGGVYPGVWVYDGSGAQVVGVRLYLTPGVLSDPIPMSQVRIVGSTVGGIINSNVPPLNPPPGSVWLNSGSTPQAGIPAGSYGYWNGSQWVNVGSTPPSQNTIAASTPPLSPVVGTVWQNTSGITVAGVPAGNYAYWNGSTWLPLGTTQPQITSGNASAGVNSINNLQGNVTLAEGSGIDITQAGNTITFTATGVEAGAPGVSSVNARTGAILIQGAGGNTVTTSPEGTVTITAAPPASSGVAQFNGRTGAVVPQAGDYTPAFIGAATPANIVDALVNHVGAPDPHAQYLMPTEIFGAEYLASNSAPTGAVAGQVWKNTNTVTVSGVGAGNFGVRTPAGAWYDAGPRYPFAINNGATAVSALAPGANGSFLQTVGGIPVWQPLPAATQNPGFLAQNNISQLFPVNVWSPLNPGSAVRDPYNGYNAVSGTFTVPAGLGGLWQIICNWENDITIPQGQLYAAFTKNSTTVSTGSVAGVASFMTVGIRSIVLVPGDIIRFYTFPLVLGSDPPTRSVISTTTSGFLIEPF